MPRHTEYNSDLHYVTEEDAPKFVKWFAERGGIVTWVSLALELMGRSYTGPYLDPDGKPSTKPHWSCADTPDRHFTDPSAVYVAIEKPVRDYKPTSGKNVNRRLAEIGPGSRVDYRTGKYLRFVEGVPLSEWAAAPR